MSITGTWNITLHGPTGAQQLVFIAAEDGGKLTGKISRAGSEPIEIKDGKIKESEATWDWPIGKPMKVILSFSGTVEGDKISGSTKLGMFGKAKFEGDRA